MEHSPLFFDRFLGKATGFQVIFDPLGIAFWFASNWRFQGHSWDFLGFNWLNRTEFTWLFVRHDELIAQQSKPQWKKKCQEATGSYTSDICHLPFYMNRWVLAGFTWFCWTLLKPKYDAFSLEICLLWTHGWLLAPITCLEYIWNNIAVIWFWSW